MKVVASKENIFIDLHINFYSFTLTSVFTQNAYDLSNVTVNIVGRTRCGTVGSGTALQVGISRV
jgi:hypothetical protein